MFASLRTSAQKYATDFISMAMTIWPSGYKIGPCSLYQLSRIFNTWSLSESVGCWSDARADSARAS